MIVEPREPPSLDEDMNRADICGVLARLKFDSDGLATLRLDRAVRDYLISLLQQRA